MPSNEEEGKRKPAKIRFRNYAPEDGALGANGAEEGNDRDSIGDTELPQKRRRYDLGADVDNSAPVERTPLELALLKAKLDARAAVVSGGVGFAGDSGGAPSMAPRKTNWDLKRDAQVKFERLERRTRRVIVELLRERLEQEATEDKDTGAGNYDDLD